MTSQSYCGQAIWCSSSVCGHILGSDKLQLR